MFSLFPQLPIELRRKIWLETLGPMTLQFTMLNPEVLKEMNVTGQQLAALYGIKRSLRDEARARQANSDESPETAPEPMWEAMTNDAQDTSPDSPETVYWDALSNPGSHSPCGSFDWPTSNGLTDFSNHTNNTTASFTAGSSQPLVDDDWTAVEDDWLAKEEKIDKYYYALCFVHGFGHYGYVALPDGSSRMSYVVESSPAYRACKESRAFLAHIFAEPVRDGGGLPSWFSFDIDTIRCKGRWLHRIGNHPWYLQTQHLYIDLHRAAHEYLDPGYYIASSDRGEKGHDWITRNLTQLKDLTIELETFDPSYGEYDWFEFFADEYYDEDGNPPLHFQVRVLSPRTPGKEWLTPQNYLRLLKAVYIDKLGSSYPDGDWREKVRVYSKPMEDVVSATDEELGDPEAFYAKYRSSWRSHQYDRDEDSWVPDF